MPISSPVVLDLTGQEARLKEAGWTAWQVCLRGATISQPLAASAACKWVDSWHLLTWEQLPLFPAFYRPRVFRRFRDTLAIVSSKIISFCLSSSPFHQLCIY